MQNNNQSDKGVDIISTFHDEIIHDISFNWHGTLMATCSSDKKVKFWKKNQDHQWTKVSEILYNEGPIWKVHFANPDIGTVVATCSIDKCVNIWEESKHQYKDEEPKWVNKYKLVEDIKQDVKDIKFLPTTLKLQRSVLGIACFDGAIRMISLRNLLTLREWDIASKIEVSKVYGCNCISWSKSYFDSPMIAVGCKQRDIVQNMTFPQNKQNTNTNGKLEAQKQIEEQKSEDEAVSTNRLFIYVLNEFDKDTTLKWKQLNLLQEHDRKPYIISDDINDISWCSQYGKDFHQIAICTNNYLKIFTFQNDPEDKFTILIKEKLSKESQNSDYCRLSWNIMGTVLAATNNKNEIILYNCSKDDQNYNIININEDEDDEKQ